MTEVMSDYATYEEWKEDAADLETPGCETLSAIDCA
jgi:hypothetical protein